MAKNAAQTLISQFKALSVEEQAFVLPELSTAHEQLRDKRIKALEREMRSLKGGSLKVFIKPMVKPTRRKPAYKYQSKKNKALRWTGRGSTPRWMREEMKALKLKPDAFLIDKRK
jgi:DNA-binding protein H-NS